MYVFASFYSLKLNLCMTAELVVLSPPSPESGSWAVLSESPNSESSGLGGPSTPLVATPPQEKGPEGPDALGPVGPEVPPQFVDLQFPGPPAPVARTPQPCRMLTGVLSLCLVCFNFYTFGLLEPVHPCQWSSTLASTSEEMPPKIWDRRFARETTKMGSEFFLIRRGAQGQWIALFPDKSLKSVKLSERKTILSTPVAGCFFAPMPQLTPTERETVRQAADEMAGQGNFPEVVQPFNATENKGLKRLMATLASLPAMGGTAIRWTSRSRYRMGGVVAAGFASYQILEISGAFDALTAFTMRVTKKCYELWEKATETSESLEAAYVQIKDIYRGVQEIITPWKLVGWLFVISFGIWMWWTIDEAYPVEEETPSNGNQKRSSPSVTSQPIPGGSAEPVNQGQTPYAMELLHQLMEQQKMMQQQLMDAETRAKTKEYLQQNIEKDREGWQQPGVSSALTGAISPSKDQKTPLKNSSAALGSAEPASAVKKPKISADPATMERLDRMAQNVSAVFKEKHGALEVWSEAQAAQHFPVGYRQRVAPSLLSSIYAENKRAKQWFEDWLSAKQLMECPEARELIAIGAALDVMMLDDPVENFINLASVESMCKKAYGITQAYANVNNKEDWHCPAGSSKSKWKTKVQWEVAKQYDPELRKDALPPVPEVEEEVNNVLNLQAQLQKVQQKTVEATKDHQT